MNAASPPAAGFARIGIVGAGLIGLGWAIVFARAGLDVRIFDQSDEARCAAPGRLRDMLAAMSRRGLIRHEGAIAARVEVVGTLADVAGWADYIQESVFERVDAKRDISRELDRLVGPGTVVGSSSSGIPASAFTEALANRARFLVVHPVNPPHLIPLVELVPAPWTDPAILPWLRARLEEVGQAPIVLDREIDGFVLNRLQGALLNEAWALFEEGIATAADIDRTVSHGLGRRWSFMGPFETIDLNAPGGIVDYAARLCPGAGFDVFGRR